MGTTYYGDGEIYIRMSKDRTNWNKIGTGTFTWDLKENNIIEDPLINGRSIIIVD